MTNHVSPRILQPNQGIYVFDNYILSLPRLSLVIGPISIKTNITDINNTIDIESVEFYVDDELMHHDNTTPYDWEGAKRYSIFNKRHKLKIVAYDELGNRGFDEITVWKFP